MFIFNNEYNLDFSKLELLYTIKTNNKCLKKPVRIRLKGKNQHLLIQTPKMYIPFGVNYNDKFSKHMYLDISFKDKDYNPHIQNFLILLKNINIKIKQILTKSKIITKRKGKLPNFSDSLKKDNYSDRLTTKLNIENNSINVYDNNKNILTIDSIQKGKYASLILNLADIWFSIDEKENIINYGLNWMVMQVKIYEPLTLKKYCFIEHSDEEDDKIKNNINNEVLEKDKIKNHPDYKIYFNMLKFHVPLENIKYKMNLNGHQSEIIDLDPNSKTPDNLIANSNNNVITKSIINQTTLKKTNTEKHKYKNNDKKTKVPSLNDILNSIKSLKKTNYKNKYMGGFLYDKEQHLSNEKMKKLKNENHNLNNVVSKTNSSTIDFRQGLLNQINSVIKNK